MNATGLPMRCSRPYAAEEVDRPDLPALECDLNPVGGRAGRSRPTQRRAPRQLADHLQRLDAERVGDGAGRVAAGDEQAASLGCGEHVARDPAECGADVVRTFRATTVQRDAAPGVECD